MKRKRIEINLDDLESYEPINSKFREQMFLKWRMEDHEHGRCDDKCKGRGRRSTSKRRQQACQPWF